MKGSSCSGEVGISAQSQGPRLFSASCRDAMLDHESGPFTFGL
jgi:hypothetical protein